MIPFSPSRERIFQGPGVLQVTYPGSKLKTVGYLRIGKLGVKRHNSFGQNHPPPDEVIRILSSPTGLQFIIGLKTFNKIFRKPKFFRGNSPDTPNR